MNLDESKTPVKPVQEMKYEQGAPAPKKTEQSAATAVLDTKPTTEQTAAPQKEKKSKPAPKRPRFKGKKAGTIRRQNRHECKKVLRQWHLRQKRERLLERLYRFWMGLPNMEWTADALYILGFWTEYLGIRIGRVLRNVLLGLGHEVQRILLSVLRPLGGSIAGFWRDVFAVLRDIANDVQATVEQTEEMDGAARKKRGRSKNPLLRYLPLLQKSAAYLLPAGALALFAFTIRSIMASSFLLEVHVNGQTVGYVQSEQIFEGAKEAVQERIANAKIILADAGMEQGDHEWEISPTYTLATEATRDGRILSQHAMTDAILTASSDEITEGTAVYVDGSLLAILSSEDEAHLSTYLNNLLTEEQNSMSYQALLANPELSDVRIEFAHKIEHGEEQSGVYFTGTVSSYDSVLNALNGSEATESYYQAQNGDTAEAIATLYGASTEELFALNPILENGAREVEAGDVITVPIHESLLGVEQKATVTWQEAIEYDTVNQESDNYYWGDNRVEQEGSDGLKELSADIVFNNGTEVDRNVTSESVLIAPVTEVVIKGTKLPSGMTAQYGSGSFIWPVPTYTYVSRWMSSYHNGADICAGYGAPILASDSGVVVTSDYHYSYGNYVVVDHGNGYRTLYAHMSQRLCSVGDAVKQGQQIGCVGSTGNSTGNHCHFEMYYNGRRFSAQSLFGGM